jgi:16S rRNA (uracil1498-N3)-methyltransferase
MRLHRFYSGPDTRLQKNFWLHDEAMLWQWNKVLRFKPGQEVVLFDGVKTERLYKIADLSKKEAHLEMITELSPRLPKLHVYLFWSLLKKENNEYIIQKCTELGVSNFVPVISERTIKKDFNLERARKIIIEASEQCGRLNIPIIREPVHLNKALEEYGDKLEMFVCHQGGKTPPAPEDKKIGLFVGPEGGWSKDEQEMFASVGVSTIDLGDFTLRAETAAIVAASKFL